MNREGEDPRRYSLLTPSWAEAMEEAMAVLKGFDPEIAAVRSAKQKTEKAYTVLEAINMLVVNGKRALRVMRERGLLVTPRRLRARRKKEWSRIVAEMPNQIWQSDMAKVWAGPNVGWAYLVSVIDACARDIVGWDLSLRCRTQEAIVAIERAVLEHTSEGPRGSGLVLNTDNGTQFTSTRFVETLSRLGITHRRTAFNHPEGNGMIERFHRSLKEEGMNIAVWKKPRNRSAAGSKSTITTALTGP